VQGEQKRQYANLDSPTFVVILLPTTNNVLSMLSSAIRASQRAWGSVAVCVCLVALGAVWVGVWGWDSFAWQFGGGNFGLLGRLWAT